MEIELIVETLLFDYSHANHLIALKFSEFIRTNVFIYYIHMYLVTLLNYLFSPEKNNNFQKS